MISFLFIAVLSLTEEPSFEYGELYIQESDERQLAPYSLSLSYAGDISNAFARTHSVVLNSQFRIWKYVSTGLWYQWTHASLSAAGQQLRNLQDIDLRTKISAPHWGLFSLSQTQFMIGKWNIFNLMALDVDLMIGAGAGVLRTKKDINGDGKYQASYLWAVDQRLLFKEQSGLIVGLFGHRDATFLHAGLHIGL